MYVDKLLITTLVLCIPLVFLSTISSRLSKLEARLIPLIFFTGLLSLTAPIVRYAVNESNGVYSRNSTQTSPITLQTYHITAILTKLEVSCGFVAFALPTFRSLLVKTFWVGKIEKVVTLSRMVTVGRMRAAKKSYFSDTELMNTTVVAESATDTIPSSEIEAEGASGRSEVRK